MYSLYGRLDVDEERISEQEDRSEDMQNATPRNKRDRKDERLTNIVNRISVYQ